MTVLPEPTPTAPAAGQAHLDTQARQMLAAVEEAMRTPTSYRDHTPTPKTGTTPPVAQPDSRIVPAWALGLAVGSIGVGAGSIGLGCAVWLACKGLSSVIHSLSTVTLAGVLTIAIPFAGLAMVATAIGGAISKAKRAVVPDVHHHHGPEYHEHHTTNTQAVWSKTTSKPRG